jgi:hypothetical protein
MVGFIYTLFYEERPNQDALARPITTDLEFECSERKSTQQSFRNF